MSDNQFQPKPYAGIETASMGFGAVEPPVQGDPAGRPAPPRRPCANADCTNPTEHPAENDWQQLLSAVPVADQLYRLAPRVAGADGNMAFPSEQDFRSAVAAVRPERTDEHSLERLRQGWTEEVAGKLADWSERLGSGLTELSEGWSGPGFETLQAACGETRNLVEGVLGDIDSTVASLQSTEDALHSLQGGDTGEIPFPAPRFWIEGDWHSWVSVHIRPAWWNGNCIEYTCQDAEHVLALAGADPELATEIIDYIDARVAQYFEHYRDPANLERDGLDTDGITVEEAKALAVADATDHYSAAVERSRRAYADRHAQIDAEIQERGGHGDDALRSVRTIRIERGYPAVADQAYINLQPPVMRQPFGITRPQTTQEPSLEPPSGVKPDNDSPWGPVGDGREEPGEGEGSPRNWGGAAIGVAAGAAGAVGTAAFGDDVAEAVETMDFGDDGVIDLGMMTDGAPDAGMDTGDSGSNGGVVEDESLWGFVDEDEDPYA
ncbi:hypothetical protein [Glycomyces buryatensis]|uniref:Uncharacterized protein n=1 Tax=Glycomyces buryatensis TaxID=2570927 RepID=A0A4S8QAV8_9ACTN|nr:hypothetical protein [Glycomyces buryatensis]THV41390.1 hypothetical protein FAB82_11355 [Glycomyces buryatensis]